MNLKELLKQHPEYADLDVVIYEDTGELHYLGDSGMCYVVSDQGTEVLVFAGN